MNRKADSAGRLQLLMLAGIFFGPLIAASWLYLAGDSMQPAGRTNHGALLEPIIAISEQLPDSPLHAHNEATWLLLYANAASCEAVCRDALYTIRQSRLMLGTEMERLKRVFLHGESAPDTLFLAAEHEGLVTIADRNLAALLERKRPKSLLAGGFYLIDPLSNLVLYFPPDINPADMVDDIKHLLELSRIG